MPGLKMKQKRMVGTQKVNKMTKEDREIRKVMKGYLAMAEDFPEYHPDMLEGAKDMVLEDIVIHERLEHYETCALLKKVFEQLEQFK